MKARLLPTLVLALALSACASTVDNALSPQPSDEPAVTEEAPVPEPAEGPLDYIPGDGTYEVGVDVVPGTYVSEGGSEPGQDCIAAVSKTPDLSGYVSGTPSSGQTIIAADKPGRFVITNSCQDFVAR